jgi:hypothetical protein
MKFKKNIFTVLCCFISIAYSFSSCKQTTEICLEPTQVNARIGFYYLKDSIYRDTFFANANIFINTNRGLVFSNIKNVSAIKLPLSQLSDTTILYIQPDSTNNATIDTLKLVYGRSNYFISNTCGFQTHFNLQKAICSKLIIDSAIIASPTITNVANATHVKIIFK